MRYKNCMKIYIQITVIILASLMISEMYADEDLFDNFQNPPVTARPRGYWSWVNGNYSYSRLTAELEEAKSKGMGGFDIWDVGILVDENNIVPDGVEFMSDESVQSIAYAIREATRLGMEMGLVLSSSWNAGGSWIKPEQGVMALYRSEEIVNGPGPFFKKLEFPEISGSPDGRNEAILEFDEKTGKPTFYQEEGVLAFRTSEDSMIASMDDIIDLSDRFGTDERLSWDVPEGSWRIVRYISSGTGQPLKLPGEKSNGLMLDHFNADAMEYNLTYILEKLVDELGDLGKTSLKYLYTDSYEANSAAWTPRMKEEFKERNGYDFTPYLPVLDGYTVIDKEMTERLLFDFRKTLSDLIIEYHYAKGVDICKRYGLEFNAEAGGPGPPVHNCPFEDIKALGALYAPRGEFWHLHPKKGHTEELQIVKGPASAAHQYNRKYVEAESFTSVWLWQYGPGDIKKIADRALCEGLNRFIYHTFPHIPPEAGYPGWVYNFGTIINTTRAWWPLSAAFHEYIARCSYMLQQGDFVGDVLYYYGDHAPNFVKPKHIDPSLGFGYDYDITNSDIILNYLDVENKKLVLPHGQEYSVLVLPNDERMRPEVLEKIRSLVVKGATVVGEKPKRSYRFHNRVQRDKLVKKVAEDLWGECNGTSVISNSYGVGKVYCGSTLRSILEELSIYPDVYSNDDQISEKLDFIHRKTTDADVYFLRNKSEKRIDLKIRFRIHDKIPELWHPNHGSRRILPVVDETDSGITVQLAFQPSEAYFLVFHDTAEDTNSNDFPYVMTDKNGSYTYQTSNDRDIEYHVSDLPSPVAIEGAWEVRFPHGWGAPDIVEFPELISWISADDDGIRHFSGIASYHKSFELTDEWFMENNVIQLDLGRVEEIAAVYLNGEYIETSWYAPHIIDISSAARIGPNHLVVNVANVLNNQLVMDAKRPFEHRKLKSNITKLPNAWMNPFAEQELLDSGLIGPVNVYCSRKIYLKTHDRK